MTRLILVFLAVLLLSVATTLAQGDVSPPELVELNIEPGHINTMSGPQTITMTARFTDDLSGFHDAFIVFAPEVGTTQSHSVHFGEGYNEVVEGDSLDGIYVDAMTLPHFAAEGWWIISQLSLVDMVGNRRDYGEFSTDGFPEYLRDFQFYNGESIPNPTSTPAPTEEPAETPVPTMPTEEASAIPTPTPEPTSTNESSGTSAQIFMPVVLN